jgi:hypothetical protein
MAMSCSTVLSARIARAQEQDPLDIIVVCNKGVKDDIDRATLSDLFLRKRLTWPSGMTAVPVNALAGSELRVEFQRRALSLTHAEEASYWKKKELVSAVTAPPEFKATLRAVFKLAGSVTYVFRSQYKEGVARLLLILPKEPKSSEGRRP